MDFCAASVVAFAASTAVFAIGAMDFCAAAAVFATVPSRLLDDAIFVNVPTELFAASDAVFDNASIWFFAAAMVGSVFNAVTGFAIAADVSVF